MTKRKSREPATTWKQIGVVAVDSGVNAIGDPCKLVRLEYGEMSPGDALYRQIEQPANGSPGDEMIPSVVSLRTGIGDGDYAVMAEVEDGMVKTIMIEFLGEDFVKALRKHIAQEKKERAVKGGKQNEYGRTVA
jgi:hypothetical protein